MWHDIETDDDLLNFGVLADTAANIILHSGNEPVSIGISGSWGVGKSSIIKMIENSLVEKKDERKKYIFIKFNAWLYQGYDDARFALIHKVADKLFEAAESNTSFLKKAGEFIKKINWLKSLKTISTVLGTMAAGPDGGAVATAISAGIPCDEKSKDSIPKEIDDIQSFFEKLLEEFEISLVIFVDDLDRCLPHTTIATLEAMRLLLFAKRTAFVIAADEHMIRNAVKTHFGDSELDRELVTSYFDKLIQISLSVPILSISEVKGYVILLLADLEEKQKKLNEIEKNQGKTAILELLKKPWEHNLSKKAVENAYGNASNKISSSIELAEQISHILASSENILGNPRLIKRFLNSLLIRHSIAKARGISINFDCLVKILLFERCATDRAFKFLSKMVAESDSGQLDFLSEIESLIASGENPELPSEWSNDTSVAFINNWLKISPPIGDINLKPYVYLSKDKSFALSQFDQLSTDAQKLLDAICKMKKNRIDQNIVSVLKNIGIDEAEILLGRLKKIAVSQQWSDSESTKILHIPIAFSALAPIYIDMLHEMPATKRTPTLVTHLKNETWARVLLNEWVSDSATPNNVKTAIETL